MKKASLSPEEQIFFRTVHNAAFANPFSELREKLDIKIAGLFPSASRREGIDQSIQEIGHRISVLEKQGRADINAYEGQDREIITIVFLFDVFHKFRDDFDQLIKDQIKAGEAPVKVHFAEAALHMFHGRGFDEKSFSHYFALSYQLRRAFYFISHSLVGSSPCMKTLRKHLWYNVFTYNIDLYNRFLWNKMEDFSPCFLGKPEQERARLPKPSEAAAISPLMKKNNAFPRALPRLFLP